MNHYVRAFLTRWGKIRPLRTHPERRAAAVAGIEGVTIRAKRGLRMLPTAWEDKMPKAQKSWKWRQKLKRKQ